jgi:hypothetical protein
MNLPWMKALSGFLLAAVLAVRFIAAGASMVGLPAANVSSQPQLLKNEGQGLRPALRRS